MKEESREEGEVVVSMSDKEWEYVKDLNVRKSVRESFEALTPKEQDYTVRHLRDSVGIEFIAALLFTLIIMVWSLFMDAPLKELANPSYTPADEKAPWYFVGLQELLAYFDPWLGGVVIPAVLFMGLLMIPFIDPNRESGIGRYTLVERPVAVPAFCFGFALWYGLIIVGQFFRGPGRVFYWPWEDRALLKEMPAVELVNFPVIGGVVFVLLYYGIGVVIPQFIFRKFCETLGVARYYIFIILFLTMMLVPVKIFLRCVFDVKYILSIQIGNTMLNF